MIINNFDQLIKKVSKFEKKRKVAVAVAEDAHTLEAVFKAKEEGIVDPILIGNKRKIDEILNNTNYSFDDNLIIDAKDEKAAAYKSVELVNIGEVDFIMKGKIQTADLLKAVVDKEKGIRTDKLMSHFAILEVPTYHKLLVITDGGMVMYPDLEEKRKIIENAVDVMLSLGYKEPKVGVLAAVENVNPKMPETVDAAELKKMNQKGEIKNCIIEGPISYDLSVNKESAEIKGFNSPVAGDVDILLASNITVGNVLAKSLIYSGNSKMAGFIVGAKAPIVLTSRGSSTEEKYLSLVLSAASV
ncbi:phosphate butyryltransferase [Keratinibaculum paraultunense]|uniref:Phosphate butyryltransferase n=1 Tax=Keratinibaculum paraultunense TaxID=1278232 RepID=A0A4R3L1I7_9FIRM|nr:bifunctional enoyl-CoA hydratase/phosphate acetyltransferase [Keratinibaculum paraultunense]QQY80116.1 bifunctional enoyl-CoA hydratase/phosphate acetyltransferase [Keratinibaculum paraultunense]TCS91563.1 phosphate butyryltransferase [Keratinibaculum paraultunense]